MTSIKCKVSLLVLLFMFLGSSLLKSQEETTPPYFGEFLTENSYEYLIQEGDGAAYVPNNILILWQAAVTPVDKDIIRTSYNVEYDTCGCGSLQVELWRSLDTIDINEKVSQSEPPNEIRSFSPNYYLFNELLLSSVINSPLSQFPAYITEYPSVGNEILVAVLDTGIDYNHPELKPYLWYDHEETVTFNSIDDNMEADCLNDPIGYNFVYENNNPIDDHSHGTHVAGTIVENLDPTQNVRLINVKTHDNHGIATMFSVVCGIYYAIHKEANIINASWGYYDLSSTPSLVLKDAIIDAEADDILVCAAAGNDAYDVGNPSYAHFPSGFTTPNNIISVGAIDVCDDNYWIHSNRSNTLIHIAAPGVDINSTMPLVLNLPNDRGAKSGTSMAAPAIAALATLEYPNTIGVGVVKNNILSNRTVSLPHLSPYVMNGQKALVSPPSSGNAVLDAKVYLEGFYEPASHLMHDQLRTGGWIPHISPYQSHVSLHPNVLVTSGNKAVVDWIFVHLYASCDDDLLVESQSALLLRDGSIVGVDGVSPVDFSVNADKYYIEIDHRNHIAIKSQFPLLLQDATSSPAYTYDFTNGLQPLNIGGIFAVSQIHTGLSKIGMIAGDADSNEQCNNVDCFDWYDCLLLNNQGYHNEDFNGNGICDDDDLGIWFLNVGKGKYY